MMYTRFRQAMGRACLAVLPVLFLHGCAATPPDPAGDGPLARLEGRLDDSLRRARDAAAEARALAESLHVTQSAQAAQLAALRQQTDGLATAAQEAARRQAQQLAETEARTLAKTQAGDAALADRMERLERRLDEVARMAEDALAAMGLGPRKIFGKVVHSVTLTDDKTLFPINSPDLGGKDAAKLDAVAEYVKRLDVNYHIAIHGHTDGLGSDDYNYALGKARAEVVKNYLHEQRGIPLLRMSVISHGATDVSSYREGSNRRIVVEVLQ
ncbi:MAG: OmpA family protein [Pseudomonadota bacterium]